MKWFGISLVFIWLIHKQNIFTWPLRDTKFLFSCSKIFHSLAALTHGIFFHTRWEIWYLLAVKQAVMLFVDCRPQTADRRPQTADRRPQYAVCKCDTPVKSNVEREINICPYLGVRNTPYLGNDVTVLHLLLVVEAGWSSVQLLVVDYRLPLLSCCWGPKRWASFQFLIWKGYQCPVLQQLIKE